MSIVRAIRKQNKPAVAEWQTHQTQNLAVDNIVWVQVPLPALKKDSDFYWIFFLIHDNRMFTERAFYYLLLDEIKINMGEIYRR